MPWITNLAPSRPAAAARTPLPRTEGQSRYEIRNAGADDEAEVLLYDEIGGWFGAWADEFVAELKGITAPRIALRLNSPGGSVFEGIAIANALRAHPANVTVYVDGIAASIASVIALAGDRLVMRPQSQLMIHDALCLAVGNAAELRETADLLDKQSDNIADAYAEKAGGTRDEWRARMVAETWYTAQEAVDAGLADEVQSFRPPAAPEGDQPTQEPAARWDLSMFRYAGRDQAPAPDDALSGDPVSVPTEPPAEVVHAPEPRPAEPEPTTTSTTSTGAPATEGAGGDPAAVTDDWAALTAHLTEDPVDDWAHLVAHLTSDTVPSSSAATA